MTDNRPSFDTYYLAIADAVALRGDCRRSQVGAVLVSRSKHTATFGYNGTSTPKAPGCLEGHCPRGLQSYAALAPGGDYANCIAVHAEENALYNSGDWSEGGTMYITRAPCDDCIRLLTNHDIHRAVWVDRSTDGDVELSAVREMILNPS